MSEQSSSKVYWGRDRVGHQQYVSGQAYPPEQEENYDEPRIITDQVDAHAVGGVILDGEYWGVRLTEPPEGVLDHFDVAAAGPDKFASLVSAVEEQLGRSSLTILAY